MFKRCVLFLFYKVLLCACNCFVAAVCYTSRCVLCLCCACCVRVFRLNCVCSLLCLCAI